VKDFAEVVLVKVGVVDVDVRALAERRKHLVRAVRNVVRAREYRRVLLEVGVERGVAKPRLVNKHLDFCLARLVYPFHQLPHAANGDKHAVVCATCKHHQLYIGVIFDSLLNVP